MAHEMLNKIIVKQVKNADAEAISRLYFETIHHVNAVDYSPGQIQAWAPRVYPAAFWHRRWRDYRVWVAFLENRTVGFAETQTTGHVDCFYVHHRYQRQGVGRALIERIVQQARREGGTRLFADVSLTARPFFRNMGFMVVRRRANYYRRCVFTQFVMVRNL